MEFSQSLGDPTREVFGNIAPWMRVLFYAIIYCSLGILGWQIWQQARLWKRGLPGGFERDWRVWLRRIAVYAVAQKKVHKKSLGAALHILLFSGFVVLTIGTTLLAISDQGPVNFHRGWYYLIYELTMDIFGVALCLGCLLAFYRRLVRRPPSLGHSARDWVLLGSLLALGITGFAVEALRLHYSQVHASVARWSVIGSALEATFLRGLDTSTTREWHLVVWWLHAVQVALFFACIPVSRFIHVITAPLNIAARPSRPMGALAPVALEEVEQTGRVGVAEVEHFNRQQLLSLDACMECGRCEDACPAWATDKPLSPKRLVVDIRKHLAGKARGEERALHGETILAETLWACTMCQACVEECPVLIGHVDLVSDMRRNLVADGQISGPPAKALTNIARQSNPFGQPNADRLAWAAGLDVPTVESNPNFEHLLWVGCAASFDPRAQKVARAMVRLMKKAEVNFAVLGRKERCTGDPARRLGDEFVFQDLAQQNVETLKTHGVKKIVTSCPHCLNTLRNEYPQFGGEYEVQHHSQLLRELVESGKLEKPVSAADTITFHDPCYLARVNGEVDAPRDILRALSSSGVAEMPRHGKKTFCCGAGGGRAWVEEAQNQRVSHVRAREAISTGATKVATGCPFCLNMMTDAVAGNAGGEDVRVMDIAELLEERIVSRENPETVSAAPGRPASNEP